MLPMILVVFLTLHCSASASSKSGIPTVAIDQANNPSAFIKNHIKKKPGAATSAEEAILFSQFGSVSQTGANQIAEMLAVGDGCDPRPTSVAIPLNASDIRAFYYPTCTKINRCGGCCGSDLSECVATQVVRTTVKVMKCRYPADSNADIFEFEGLVDIPLDVHTACECRCRVQAYHCDPVKHVYSADTCACQCRNRQMATQCPSNKNWDEQECACVCPRIPNCLADEFFNFNTCSCERGSLSLINTAPVDPCATSTVRCRPGWVPTALANGQCLCRVASRKRRRHVASSYANYDRHSAH